MIDFSKLDKTIHEKGRLAIMTLLATRRQWSFQDLKGGLKMSDGNLITHLRALNKSGFVSMKKQASSRPQTYYALTRKGRKSFEDYLELLEKIIDMGKQ